MALHKFISGALTLRRIVLAIMLIAFAFIASYSKAAEIDERLLTSVVSALFVYAS